GLDVLAQEPPDPANPLLSMPNVLLTAHTAGHSEDAMADNREQSVEKVLGFLQGRWPDTALNPEVEAGAAARARAFAPARPGPGLRGSRPGAGPGGAGAGRTAPPTHRPERSVRLPDRSVPRPWAPLPADAAAGGEPLAGRPA